MIPTRTFVQPPPQLSEATFRTYEPYLHRAIQAWPEETKWSPEEMVNETTRKTLSPHTFAARMRDSVVSLQRFQWQTYIDLSKFATIFGVFCIAYDQDGSVWFRNRGRRGRPLALTAEGRANGNPTPMVDPSVPAIEPVWATWSPDEVRAAATLLSTGRFTTPIILTGPLPDDLTRDLLSLYNIGLFFDSQRNQTILS